LQVLAQSLLFMPAENSSPIHAQKTSIALHLHQLIYYGTQIKNITMQHEK